MQTSNQIAIKVRLLSDFIFSSSDLYQSLRRLLDCPSVKCLQWADDGQCILIVRHQLHELGTILRITGFDNIVQWLCDKLLPCGFQRVLRTANSDHMMAGFFKSDFSSAQPDAQPYMISLPPYPFQILPPLGSAPFLPQSSIDPFNGIQYGGSNMYQRPPPTPTSTSSDVNSTTTLYQNPVYSHSVMQPLLPVMFRPPQFLPPNLLPILPHYHRHTTFGNPTTHLCGVDQVANVQAVPYQFAHHFPPPMITKHQNSYNKATNTSDDDSDADSRFMTSHEKAEQKITLQKMLDPHNRSRVVNSWLRDVDSQDEIATSKSKICRRPTKKEKATSTKDHTMKLVNNPHLVNLFGNAYMRWKRLKNGELPLAEEETTRVLRFDYSSLYDNKTMKKILVDSRKQEEIDRACQSILLT